MGIDIRPGRASWSYSGFMEFREKLAAAEGLNLREMQGFTTGGKPWEFSNGQHVTPLAPLLSHSDCDGYLDAHECEEVLPRLRQIVDGWAGQSGFDPVRDYDVHQARELIGAMEHSVEHRCSVVFG
jgi:hypothetical protein